MSPIQQTSGEIFSAAAAAGSAAAGDKKSVYSIRSVRQMVDY